VKAENLSGGFSVHENEKSAFSFGNPAFFESPCSGAEDAARAFGPAAAGRADGFFLLF
jgi:hypothetical protein